MSFHVSCRELSPPAAVQSEYAHFCQWLRAFFAQHPDPEGIHAVHVFNAAFRAGFNSRAGQYLFQAAGDGTLKQMRFNRFVLEG